MHKLQRNQYKQNLLFQEENTQKEFCLEKLNNLIDNINKKNGRDILGWGSSIIEREWRPRRDKLYHLKTTTIESIPTVFAN